MAIPDSDDEDDDVYGSDDLGSDHGKSSAARRDDMIRAAMAAGSEGEEGDDNDEMIDFGDALDDGDTVFQDLNM